MAADKRAVILAVKGAGRHGVVLFLLLLAAALLLPCLPAEGSSAAAVKVTAGTLNLRSGPGTSYEALGKLSAGTTVHVLHREEEWLLVTLDNDSSGWVAGQYTEFCASMVDRLPSPLHNSIEVQASLLNIRSGPGLEFETMGQLQHGSTTTAYFQQGDWLLVKLHDGSTGWLAHRYTSFDETAVQAAESAGEENDSAVEEAVLTGEREDEKEGDSREEEELPKYRVTVTASALRVREGPGLDYTQAGTLPGDTLVDVLQEKKDWLQVLLPEGEEGWIAGWHTSKLPEEEKKDTTEEVLFKLVSVNVDALRVRSGPGLEYEQSGRVSRGNSLLVLEEEKGWYNVKLPCGGLGWVCGDYVDAGKITSAKSGNPGLPESGGTATDSLDSSSLTIVIDPGHGGNDAGSTGFSGLKEKDVNLKVSRHLAELLQEKGFHTVMTRSSDKNIGLAERVELAENAGADLFISIHANAHPNSYTSGTETYYVPGRDTSTSSFSLASLIQEEVSRAYRLPSRGVKKANFHVIRETSMPAVLVELAFLSNAVDETILRSQECRELGAAVITRAVLRHYNLL